MKTEFSSIIRKRRENAAIKRGYLSLILRSLIVIAAVYLIFSRVFMLTQAKGMGMFPAVKDGDLVVAYRLQSKYEKNDVVVYRAGGETRIGRVLAKGSDNIDIGEDGTVRVNGTVQTGEILYPTFPRQGDEYPVKIPDNCLYILGDYRTNTKDSRDFGPIPMDGVKGKVITILRRRGL